MTYRISCQNGVSLRALTCDDVSQQWVDWLNDPVVNRYLEVRHRPQTLATVSDYVQSLDKLPGALFGIFYLDHGHVGNLRIDIDPIHRRAVMGIIVGEASVQKQGVASAAVTAGCNWAMAEQGCEKVIASAYEPNLASINLFRRCGFAIEAVVADYWQLDDERVGHVIMGYPHA